MYDEISDTGIAVTLYRSRDVAGLRQLAIFCHSAWFEDKGWKVSVPGAFCFYKKHGDPIDTDLAISNALAKEHNIIPLVELIPAGQETFDYSLRANENNSEVVALWQAAELAEMEPPDLLIVTGCKDPTAGSRADKYLRLSEVFVALRNKGFDDFDLYRFYGCRDLQKSTEASEL